MDEQPQFPPSTQGEPPSVPLIARLFVVPAILVSMLVVGLMIVVVLFGWSSIGQRPSVTDLVKTLKSAPGDRKGDVALFPQDKEVWLAAQELAERLRRRDQELKPDELGQLANDLATIMAEFEARPAGGAELSQGERLKAVFVLLALARVGVEPAAATVFGAMASPDAEIRQTAVRACVELPRDAIKPEYTEQLARLLNDSSHEVQLLACVALGQLARPGDAAAVAALATKLSDDRELRWNAALALGRLGSLRGKLELLSMLDRSFWQRSQVEYTARDGAEVKRPFTPRQIEEYMTAAIDVAAGLDDPDLRKAVAALTSDPSVMVRERAGRVKTAS